MEPGFPPLERAAIAVVGLGLMGGSFVLALRQQGLGQPLIGIEKDAATRARARPYLDELSADLSRVRQAHLIVLAAPVRAILHLLRDVAPHARPGAILLDFGSTKLQVVEAMRALPSHLQAVGGHPLCGRERSGFAAATPDLFRGTRFVLTPLERTSPQAMEFVTALLRRLEIQPIQMSAQEHDALLAVSSHLPYLLSATLMEVALQASVADERLFQVIASGFRDASRLAASNPQMMLDILLTNREAILTALRSAQGVLAQLSSWLAMADEASLRRWMEQVSRARADLDGRNS